MAALEDDGNGRTQGRSVLGLTSSTVAAWSMSAPSTPPLARPRPVVGAATNRAGAPPAVQEPIHPNAGDTARPTPTASSRAGDTLDLDEKRGDDRGGGTLRNWEPRLGGREGARFGRETGRRHASGGRQEEARFGREQMGEEPSG